MDDIILWIRTCRSKKNKTDYFYTAVRCTENNILARIQITRYRTKREEKKKIQKRKTHNVDGTRDIGIYVFVEIQKNKIKKILTPRGIIL